VAQVALDTFGTISAVVPNAGIGRYGSVLDWSDDEINEMMRTNFEGTVHIVRACLPTMIGRQRGDVVIVSSVAGFRGEGMRPFMLVRSTLKWVLPVDSTAKCAKRE